MIYLVRCELFFYITGATIIYFAHDSKSPLLWDVDCENSLVSLAIFPGYFDYITAVDFNISNDH